MLKRIRKIIIPIFIITIIFLTISNIHLNNKIDSLKEDEEQLEIIKYCPKEDSKYNDKKVYYNTLNYKTFKKLMTKNTVVTIGIVDKKTSTSNKFIEYINRLSYNNNKSYYLMDINKLSKKNLIAFYELDERLKELDNNYIITIKKNKIISITMIEEEEINTLIERFGE